MYACSYIQVYCGMLPTSVTRHTLIKITKNSSGIG